LKWFIPVERKSVNVILLSEFAGWSQQSSCRFYETSETCENIPFWKSKFVGTVKYLGQDFQKQRSWILHRFVLCKWNFI